MIGREDSPTDGNVQRLADIFKHLRKSVQLYGEKGHFCHIVYRAQWETGFKDINYHF